jgi:recombination DNA repair RAD52 pathway protein
MSYLTESQLGQLLRPLNKSRVLQKQGQSHLEAYDIRAHLNRIFGFGRWSGDVVEMTLVAENHGTNKSGKPAVTVVYRAGYRLTVRALNGETLATYTEYASGDAQNFPAYSLGDAHDFAMKTAESQALKRAAINLGDQFGLSLYNKGSLGPLVQVTLAMPDADPSKEGVDDTAPQVTPEEEPETAQEDATPEPAPADDAAATAIAQYRHEQPNWAQLLNAAKNNREMLLDLLAKAKGMNAPQTVIDGITAAGKALQERSAAA